MSEPRLILKLNPDLQLKQLGTIRGNNFYIDLASVKDDEQKFLEFLIAQKLVAEFFNPPKDATPNKESKG